MADRPIVAAIPEQVRLVVAQHLRESSVAAQRGWKNAPTGEDTLTGDLGRSLRTEWSEQTEANGYFWRWRIQYRKFGAGNQHSSEEKLLGADGIVQVEVKRFKVGVQPVSSQTVSLENVEGEYEFQKGVLFQSKRHDSSDSKKLLDEVKLIEKLSEGNGIYVEYGPKEYRVSLAKEVIDVNGVVSKIPADKFFQLGQFFADKFMECVVGVEGMYVDLDSDPQILHLPEENTATRKIGVRLSHALNVQVTAFKMVRFEKG